MRQRLMMMFSIIWLVFAVPCLALQESAQPENNSYVADTDVPSAVVKETKFEFAPVLDGAVVEHEFALENSGTAPLLINKIKTGCGCTTADYDKMIAPGESGKILIKANTRGYGGQMFSRDIQVMTNDPAHPQTHLSISGQVNEFAKIDPKSVFLQGKAGDTIESAVTISPNAKYPFHILAVNPDKEIKDKIEAELESKENSYALKVRNRLNASGNYFGNLQLTTDSPAQHEITISVRGRIQ